MEYTVDRAIIESNAYMLKFKGLTSSEKGDELVAHYARQAVLNNDGLSSEDAYFLNAKNGKLLKHQKLGEFGGTVEELPKLKKGELILLIHNHPNNTAFSYVDFVTLNDFPEIKTMIAAGHDGKVFILSVGDGERLDLSDENELRYYKNQWANAYIRFGGDLGAVKQFAKEWGWIFYER